MALQKQHVDNIISLHALGKHSTTIPIFWQTTVFKKSNDFKFFVFDIRSKHKSICKQAQSFGTFQGISI